MSIFWIIFFIIIAAGFAGFALYWYAFRFEPVNFVLSEIDINIDTSPGHSSTAASLDHDMISSEPESVGVRQPLTILHLSDFHLRKGRKGKKLFSFVNSLKNIEPDLILLTGDLVEKDEYVDYLIDMLSGLDAKMGKYAVLGVHDYYNKTIKEFVSNMVKRKKEYRRLNDVKELISKLDSIGVKVLKNESVLYNFKDRSNRFSDYSERAIQCKPLTAKDTIGYLQIIGLEDSIIKKTEIAKAFSNISGNMEELPVEDNYSKNNIRSCFTINRSNIHELHEEKKINICMTHTPERDVICEIARRGADIVLCGHTHGGQVRIPGLGAIITGSNISARYASGLFYFKKFVLFTSRGLGEGKYSPFRFFCRPEACLIKINVTDKTL